MQLFLFIYLFWLVIALCKLFFWFKQKGNEISQLDCAANCYGLHRLGFQGKNDPSAKKNFTTLGEFAFFWQYCEQTLNILVNLGEYTLQTSAV